MHVFSPLLSPAQYPADVASNDDA